MQFQIKFLRRAGVRLSHVEIEALPWVVAQVVTWHGPGGSRLRLHDMSHTLLVNPSPHRELFKYSIAEIAQEHITLFGIEQRTNEEGATAAVAQEWRLTRVNIGTGGWRAANERGITNELASLDALP